MESMRTISFLRRALKLPLGTRSREEIEQEKGNLAPSAG